MSPMMQQGPAAPQAQPSAVVPKEAPTVFDQAKQEFPILNNVGLLFKNNPGGGKGFLEFWPADETGTPEAPRPKEFPVGKAGVEVYDPKTRPIDVMGDVASHYLIENDPQVQRYYQQFQKSMTPAQTAQLHEQYEWAQRNAGETRPFEDWKTRTGLPGWFRGYAFQQWDKPEEYYTPEQMKMFDQMMAYLRKTDDQHFDEGFAGK